MRDWYSIKNKADDHAEVWIYEQIGEDWFGDGVSAKNFVKDLNALKAKTIDLHLNSPGGSVFDGHAIFNALKSHPATVTTYIDGLAASIASTIALAGDRVVMAKNALMMIHDPWGVSMGTAEEMRKTADVLDKVKDTIIGVYEDRSRHDRERIKRDMSAETWLDATEAADYGFVDEIADEMKLAACFDLASLPFKHVPQSLTTGDEPVAEPEPAGQVHAEDTEEPGSEEDPAPAPKYPAPII